MAELRIRKLESSTVGTLGLTESLECWGVSLMLGPSQWLGDLALTAAASWIWSFAQKLHMLHGSQKKKKRIKKLEDGSISLSPSEEQREERWKKGKGWRGSEKCGIPLSYASFCVMGVPEREERERKRRKKQRKIIEGIMALMKNINLPVQEVQQIQIAYKCKEIHTLSKVHLKINPFRYELFV